MLDRPTLHILRVELDFQFCFVYHYRITLSSVFDFYTQLNIILLSHFQTINEKDDDPSAANPMLYGPLQGARISKTNQYIATVICTNKFYFNIFYLVHLTKSKKIIFFFSFLTTCSMSECGRSGYRSSLDSSCFATVGNCERNGQCERNSGGPCQRNGYRQ